MICGGKGSLKRFVMVEEQEIGGQNFGKMEGQPTRVLNSMTYTWWEQRMWDSTKLSCQAYLLVYTGWYKHKATQDRIDLILRLVYSVEMHHALSRASA